MITQNQLNDFFSKSDLKRNATPFEYDTYKNTSVQDLSGIGKQYTSLNKDTSITDYLKYNGMDSSPQARQKLSVQYGISGSGTAEGNTALLTALKGGSTQSTTTPTNASQGSISGATAPSIDPTTQGSIETASQPSQNTPDNNSTYKENPQLAPALKDYQGVQKQITDISTALENEFQQKKKQVEASGGIVNEAQLRGLVQAEKAPLIEQRNLLIGQQSTLGRTYQTLLNQDRQDKTNSIKGQQFNQKTAYENATLAQRGSIAAASQSTRNEAQSFNEKLKTAQLQEKTQMDSARIQTQQSIARSRMSLTGNAQSLRAQSLSLQKQKFEWAKGDDKIFVKNATDSTTAMAKRSSGIEQASLTVDGQFDLLKQATLNLDAKQVKALQDNTKSLVRVDTIGNVVPDLIAIRSLKASFQRQTGSPIASAYIEQLINTQAAAANLQKSIGGGVGGEYLFAMGQHQVAAGLSADQLDANRDQMLKSSAVDVKAADETITKTMQRLDERRTVSGTGVGASKSTTSSISKEDISGLSSFDK